MFILLAKFESILGVPFELTPIILPGCTVVCPILNAKSLLFESNIERLLKSEGVVPVVVGSIDLEIFLPSASVVSESPLTNTNSLEPPSNSSFEPIKVFAINFLVSLFVPPSISDA